MKIKLHPKTQHGRNRVKEKGDIGEVLYTSPKVVFNNESGPWLLTDAAGLRWVHKDNDKNFDIEIL